MVVGDTIAAIATAPGRGGIAVVRVSGPEALEIAAKLTGRTPAIGRAVFARVASCSRGSGDSRSSGGSGKSIIDTGLLLAFKSPHSYTGEDVVEFQCHGGIITPRRVLKACLAAGARLARRGEFTERAFLNGRVDYDQAESVLNLIDAKTARAADAALEGLAGRRRRECRALYEQALELSTRLEHALDIDEGELPADFLSSINSQLSMLNSQLRTAIRRAAEGQLLRRGALVVLAGPPNAGKSSLLNVLLGEHRAIVSEVPGTTRDTIEAWIDLDGWPIRLVDTAGLRETKDEIEGEGVRRSEDQIAQADVVVLLGGCEVEQLRSCGRSQPLDFSTSRLLNVHSKCDLGRGEGLNVSAKTGEGLNDLKRAIVAKLEEKVVAADFGDSPEGDVVAYHEALAQLSPHLSSPPRLDLVLLANAVRGAAERLGAAVGATYSADLLDKLFSRFCVGK